MLQYLCLKFKNNLFNHLGDIKAARDWRSEIRSQPSGQISPFKSFV